MHSFKHTVFFIWLRGFQQNMVETVYFAGVSSETAMLGPF